MNDSEITTTILRQIRDEIINVKTELTNVKTEVTNVKTEITNVKTELTNVKTEVKNVRTELKAEIVKTNARLDLVVESSEAVSRYVKNIARRHDKAIDELRMRVARLEARRKN